MTSDAILRAVIIMAGLSLLGLSQTYGAETAHSPFDALITKRQEQLYYNLPTLPDDVKALITTPIPLADTIAYYQTTTDELIKFNIVLIIDKKIRAHQYNNKDNALACDFLIQCLAHANPWIVTEAVYALGNTKRTGALVPIQNCLSSPYATVVYHAAMAIQMITGAVPDLTAEERKLIASASALSQTGNNDALNGLATHELMVYETKSDGTM